MVVFDRKTPGASWFYEYDENGNFIHVDYGIGNSTFQYEFGERVVVGGFNPVRKNIFLFFENIKKIK